MNRVTLLLCFIAIPMLAKGTFAQMEKRENALYRQWRFEKSFPKVGQTAPQMEVRDLHGKTIHLSNYRGKTIVLIKAGYT